MRKKLVNLKRNSSWFNCMRCALILANLSYVHEHNFCEATFSCGINAAVPHLLPRFRSCFKLLDHPFRSGSAINRATMLEALPPELIAKVFQCLLDSPRDYKNLSRTCRKLCEVASRYTEKTALSFFFDLDFVYYSGVPCELHGQCPDLVSRKGANCEQQFAETQNLIRAMKVQNISDITDLDAQSCCYYHRLYCMLHAKYTTFSSMRFSKTNMRQPDCLMAFEISPQPHKLNALAELELSHCITTLEWLDTMLKHLKNLDFLTLDSTYFTDVSRTGPQVNVNLANRDRKVLKALRIISMMHQVNDSEFKYLIENCPAIELDLTTIRIEDRPLILHRFYGNSRSDVDIWTQPSKHILSFNMVHLYLSRHKNVLRSFRAFETSLASHSVLRILDEMKDLHLTCRADGLSIKAFRELLLPSDLKRLDLIVTPRGRGIY